MKYRKRTQIAHLQSHTHIPTHAQSKIFKVGLSQITTLHLTTFAGSCSRASAVTLHLSLVTCFQEQDKQMLEKYQFERMDQATLIASKEEEKPRW